MPGTVFHIAIAELASLSLVQELYARAQDMFVARFPLLDKRSNSRQEKEKAHISIRKKKKAVEDFVNRKCGVENLTRTQVFHTIQTPVYAAAILADVDAALNIVKFLTGKCEADGHALGWAGDTALHALIMHHSPDDANIWHLATALLAAGASAAKGPHGSSPLFAAARNDYVDIAWLLLLNGAEPRRAIHEQTLAQVAGQRCSPLMSGAQSVIACEAGEDMDTYPEWLLSQATKRSMQQKGAKQWQLSGQPVGEHVGRLVTCSELVCKFWRSGEFSDLKAFDDGIDELMHSGAQLLAVAHKLRHSALMHRVRLRSSVLAHACASHTTLLSPSRLPQGIFKFVHDRKPTGCATHMPCCTPSQQKEGVSAAYLQAITCLPAGDNTEDRKDVEDPPDRGFYLHALTPLLQRLGDPDQSPTLRACGSLPSLLLADLTDLLYSFDDQRQLHASEKPSDAVDNLKTATDQLRKHMRQSRFTPEGDDGHMDATVDVSARSPFSDKTLLELMERDTEGKTQGDGSGTAAQTGEPHNTAASVSRGRSKTYRSAFHDLAYSATSPRASMPEEDAAKPGTQMGPGGRVLSHSEHNQSVDRGRQLQVTACLRACVPACLRACPWPCPSLSLLPLPLKSRSHDLTACVPVCLSPCLACAAGNGAWVPRERSGPVPWCAHWAPALAIVVRSRYTGCTYVGL